MRLNPSKKIFRVYKEETEIFPEKWEKDIKRFIKAIEKENPAVNNVIIIYREKLEDVKRGTNSLIYSEDNPKDYELAIKIEGTNALQIITTGLYELAHTIRLRDKFQGELKFRLPYEWEEICVYLMALDIAKRYELPFHFPSMIDGIFSLAPCKGVVKNNPYQGFQGFFPFFPSKDA